MFGEHDTAHAAYANCIHKKLGQIIGTINTTKYFWNWCHLIHYLKYLEKKCYHFYAVIFHREQQYNLLQRLKKQAFLTSSAGLSIHDHYHLYHPKLSQSGSDFGQDAGGNQASEMGDKTSSK